MISSSNISSRRIPRQQRSQQTVEAVLAAVPLVVKRYGLSSVTTNRIAEVAGVSIGSLYQYFPDKISIFSALQERHVADVRLILQRQIRTHESSSFSEFAIDLVEELVDLHSVESQTHHLISESIDVGSKHFRHALRAIFEHAIARSGCENVNRILFVLPSLVEGIVHGVDLSPLTPRENKGEAVKATLAYLSNFPELGKA